MEHLCSTPVSIHEKMGCRLGPSHLTLPTSSRPSSAHLSAFSFLVEELSPVSSDFNEDGEESEIHPLVKNLDDASQHVTIGGVAKKRVLALPHPV